MTDGATQHTSEHAAAHEAGHNSGRGGRQVQSQPQSQPANPQNSEHAAAQVSEIFDPSVWQTAPGAEQYRDVTAHLSLDGQIARIAFNRPEVRNAFRPQTVDELFDALERVRTNPRVGVVLLTGNGPSPRDGGWAFCSGGDQRIRGKDGYKYAETDDASGIDAARAGRLHILEVQRLIRFMPKVVIALVPGWAAGGGHSLNVVCDLTIASAEHAKFKQTDADVGSFDAGYGSAYFARQIGQKFAREVFFLAEEYDAQRAYEMGVVNRVVPHAELEATGIAWARTILGKSPTAIRMLKYAFNAVDDGIVGQQIFAGEATRLAYGTDEAVEGRDSFLQKREPDWSAFPYHF
ncbi:MAG: 1,4-dihydroxy-2-naphthoyl-CoA synthase [Microbacteriaceae bacterium]|nr:1,4-dihydroxy-2-naphthoyl-CoA synthase [Microbacteriaceae bacterium]